MSFRSARIWLFLAILILIATACAGADEGEAFSDSSLREVTTDSMGLSEPASAILMEVPERFGADSSTAAVSQSAPEAPASGILVEVSGRFARSFDASTSESAPDETAEDGSSIDLGIGVQQRLIVRNVAMSLVVLEVSEALNAVSTAARGVGGWVVSTVMTTNHIATISVRVPAAQLDSMVQWLRDLATEVDEETWTSQDVTEEFVDISARITNLEATEAQLRALFEREGDIEDILAVQRELTRTREEIERLAGRKRLLEQTAATSLIRITLQAEPSTIPTDAGTDRVLVEGETARFRAEFTPPDGIDEFEYEWNFGDGSPTAHGTTTAPANEAGKRTTATIVHVYRNQEDSPFYATLTITGTGDAGIAEGEDTVQVTVTSVPNVQVSAGEDVTAAVGERVFFGGSFTRPEGVTDLKVRWDFGDGLAPLESNAPTDDSTIEAEHEYTIDRAEPYTVTLSVTGRTEHGAEVHAEDTLFVYVVPASVWSTTVIDVGETARAATRAFSATLQGLLGLAIWVGVFSPVLAGAIALGLFINRRRSRSERTPPPDSPPDTDASSTGETEPSDVGGDAASPIDPPRVDNPEDRP